MKKKLLIIFIIVISFIVLKSDICASKVSTYELLTYIDAGDNDEGILKRDFYNGQNLDVSNGNQSTKQKFLSFDKWNNTQTNSFFIMGIWKEILGGNLAFCLDPGKGVAEDYIPVEQSKMSRTISELLMERKQKELIYATIYNAKFTDIGIISSDGTKIDSDGEYVIKQILFWAYIATYEEGFPIFSILQDNYRGDFFNFNHSENSYFTVSYFSENKNAKMGYLSLSNDIVHALAHLYNREGGKSNLSSIALSTLTNQFDPIYTINKERVFKDIIERLESSWNDLRFNDKSVDIIEYTPNGSTNTYQRFVSIYVPPTELETNKYYATAESLDNGSSISYVDPSFSNMNGNNVSKLRPDKSSDYIYQGYMVYRSRSDYDGSPQMVINQSIITDPLNGNATCTLNYDNSLEYNVIVFIYKKQPKYTLTYNYYYKSASESEYHYIESGTPEAHQRNAKVRVPKIYNDTYNTTLYNGYHISTTVSDLSTVGDYINFTMPASDVTVNIYYQYGQVTIKKYIKNNDGTDTPVGLPETKDLTSDQIIGIPSTIDGRGYFIYEQNGSKEYLPTPGDREIKKGKDNIYISLYYARRILDHRHVLKVGPSYGGVLETRRN